MNVARFSPARRLVLAASLFAIAGSIAMTLRSNVVEDEWSYTSTHRRVAIASQIGALQISFLHRNEGTVQTYGIKNATGASVDEYLGTEVPFNPAEASYSHDLTVPIGSIFVFPSFYVRRMPDYLTPGPVTNAPGTLLMPLSVPKPVSFITGTSILIPYWVFLLIGLTPVLLAAREKLKTRMHASRFTT